MPELSDRFGRHFQYLRLSITDACNFKCTYCLPNGYQKPKGAAGFLSLPEILNLAQAFSELGTFKIRITGGEPTLRPDLIDIFSGLDKIKGIDTLALSTNGTKLKTLAPALKLAGVKSINVSIDSLDPSHFKALTGMDRLSEVQAGIQAAIQAGISQVKVNALLLKDVYRDEFFRFEAWVKTTPVTVRFIELMPTGNTLDFFRKNHLEAKCLRELLLSRGWIKKSRSPGDGPAEEYFHPESLGRLGIIAPYGPEFCSTCNRLRVSSRGELRLCLFAESNRSLRHLLQSSEQKDELKETLQKWVGLKETSHYLPEGKYGNNFTFSAIGG